MIYRVFLSVGDATDEARVRAWPQLVVRQGTGDPDVLCPPDAIIVAPATVNTSNKWGTGIRDTLALGLLVEAIGKHLPVVALPFTNRA